MGDTESIKIEYQKFARSRWGSDEQYYRELERFLKTHCQATSIVHDNITGMPIKAEYIFAPYSVVVEHEQLIEKLRQAAKEFEESLQPPPEAKDETKKDQEKPTRRDT